MSRDVRNFTLLALLLLALIFWMKRMRRTVMTQTATSLRFTDAGPYGNFQVSDIKDELNRPLERICTYNMGASFVWPTVGEPCPPMFQSQVLTSDSVRPKI